MTVYRSYRLWPCPLVRRQQRRLEGRALLLAVRTRNSSAEAERPRPEDPCCRGGRCRYLSALLQHSSRVLQLLQSGARVKLWRVRAGRMLASGPGSCWQSESEMMWPPPATASQDVVLLRRAHDRVQHHLRGRRRPLAYVHLRARAVVPPREQ